MFIYILLSLLFTTFPYSLSEASDNWQITNHRLYVELSPQTHQIKGSDTITLRSKKKGATEIEFYLNKNLSIEYIRSEGNPLPYTIIEILRPEEGRYSGFYNLKNTRRIRVTLPVSPIMEEVSLEVSYKGEIYDPLKEPKFLRFVTPTETTGIIGEEGVYLSGETFWYPDIPGSLPTFEVTSITPAMWEVVSQGKLTERALLEGNIRTTWHSQTPADALTLVSGKYMVTSEKREGVEILTYLYPEDAHLSSEYIEASARYIATYSKILGPYPFPKFAIVENFFPSGLGMPSFTLLGSQVIKRRYIQPYALGHEIVHCWLGNYVFNEPESGNWVEGFTTYLANYYYDEMTQGEKAAKEHRRRMLMEYSTYVTPEKDYPLSKFLYKRNQVDSAIGYQKAAMIFHMTRKIIGDEAFFKGLRTFIGRAGGGMAGWSDLQKVFEETGGKKLEQFFQQWVYEAGAPILRLDEVEGKRIEGGYQIKAKIAQEPKPFYLNLPIIVEISEKSLNKVFEIRSSMVELEIRIPSEPLSIKVDPDYNIFRRLDRKEMAPNLNMLLEDTSKIIVYPTGGIEEENIVYKKIADRIAEKGEATVKADKDVTEEDMKNNSLFLLGGEGVNTYISKIKDRIGQPNGIGIEKGSFLINNIIYSESGNSLLITVRNPLNEEKTITIFLGLSAEAVNKISPVLFFYGWNSYTIFGDGKVITKGDFSLQTKPLEYRFK